jgi:hypothetical protein
LVSKDEACAANIAKRPEFAERLNVIREQMQTERSLSVRLTLIIIRKDSLVIR